MDIAGPRSDGRFLVAAGGLLHLLDASTGELEPFARGVGGYSTDTGEPYIALAPKRFQGPGGCSYGREATYAIETGADAGVIRISRAGKSRRFASFNGFPTGIVFDRGGRFDHRLLVAVHGLSASPSVLFAYDCDGGVETITEDGPNIEGGMAIAPKGFGDFGRKLIAPDEFAGLLYAIGPRGGVRVVADSGIPSGLDIGVESGGFVPSLDRGGTALLADPGRDVILGLGRRALRLAGVERGDLLVAAEAVETRTIAVSCDPGCSAREVAVGPAPVLGHAEGHLEFFRGGER